MSSKEQINHFFVYEQRAAAGSYQSHVYGSIVGAISGVQSIAKFQNNF